MNCQFCNKEYLPKQPNQLYCSPRCRQDKASQKHGWIKKNKIRQWVNNSEAPDNYICELLEFIENG